MAVLAFLEVTCHLRMEQKEENVASELQSALRQEVTLGKGNVLASVEVTPVLSLSSAVIS